MGLIGLLSGYRLARRKTAPSVAYGAWRSSRICCVCCASWAWVMPVVARTPLTKRCWICRRTNPLCWCGAGWSRLWVRLWGLGIRPVEIFGLKDACVLGEGLWSVGTQKKAGLRFCCVTMPLMISSKTFFFLTFCAQLKKGKETDAGQPLAAAQSEV